MELTGQSIIGYKRGTGGTAGVSGDTDTIYAVHTCAARFANCYDQPARLLELHGRHGLC